MMRFSETNKNERQSLLRRVVTVLMVAALLPGCGTAQDAGSMSIDLSYFAQKTGGLTSQDAKSFHVRVYPKSPPQTSLDTLYDSGCLDLKGTAFRIGPLGAGEDRSVELRVFSETGCDKDALSYIAYRGSLLIEGGVEKMYTLTPLKVGGSTSLPVPSAKTRDMAWNTECETHDDCRQGVHPASFCVIQEGHCALVSLYPLNNYAPRAFHKTVSLSPWDSVSVGGVGSISESGLVGTDTLVEHYSAAKTTFDVPFVDKFSGETRVSFNEVVRLDDERILTVGGLQVFEMTRLEDSVLFEVNDQICTQSNNCFDNPIGLAHVINMGSKTAKASALPASIAFTRVGVSGVGGSEVVVFGGVVWSDTDDESRSSKSIHRCAVDSGSGSLDCETMEQTLSSERFGHELVCVDQREDGSCGKIIVAGGYETPPELIADLYRSEKGTIESLTVQSTIASPGGWKWINTGKAILSFGGTTGSFGDKANTPPYRVVYNDGTIDFVPLELGELSEEKTYRSFHEVVLTAEGIVLVIGGLDHDNQATTSVLRFTALGEFIDEVHMTVPRFAHSAVAIDSGPMIGSTLIQGGALFVDGELQLLGGSEIYRDAP